MKCYEGVGSGVSVPRTRPRDQAASARTARDPSEIASRKRALIDRREAELTQREDARRHTKESHRKKRREQKEYLDEMVSALHLPRASAGHLTTPPRATRIHVCRARLFLTLFHFIPHPFCSFVASPLDCGQFPKATGRDALREKKAASRSIARERERSPDGMGAIPESRLMGGGDDFAEAKRREQARHARRNEARERKRLDLDDKLTKYEQEEEKKMDQFRAMLAQGPIKIKKRSDP